MDEESQETTSGQKRLDTLTGLSERLRVKRSRLAETENDDESAQQLEATRETEANSRKAEKNSISDVGWMHGDANWRARWRPLNRRRNQSHVSLSRNTMMVLLSCHND